jgi:hypothetical protein
MNGALSDGGSACRDLKLELFESNWSKWCYARCRLCICSSGTTRWHRVAETFHHEDIGINRVLGAWIIIRRISMIFFLCAQAKKGGSSSLWPKSQIFGSHDDKSHSFVLRHCVVTSSPCTMPFHTKFVGELGDGHILLIPSATHRDRTSYASR